MKATRELIERMKNIHHPLDIGKDDFNKLIACLEKALEGYETNSGTSFVDYWLGEIEKVCKGE